jgi:hypothetical protein
MLQKCLIWMFCCLAALAFAGCANDLNVLSVNPHSGLNLIHFSQSNGKACGAANIRMWIAYEGRIPPSELEVMTFADHNFSGDLSLNECKDYLNTLGSIPCIEGYSWYTNNRDRDAVTFSQDMAGCVSVGQTPMVGISGMHLVSIGGYASEGNVRSEFLLVWDPSVPDTAREKMLKVRRRAFMDRANVVDLAGNLTYVYLVQNVFGFPTKGYDGDEIVLPDTESQAGTLCCNRGPSQPDIAPAIMHRDDVEPVPPNFIDTVKAYANNAIWKNSQANLVTYAQRYGTLLSDFHWGEVYPTSKDNWDAAPPESKIATGPALYMWVCETISNSNNELFGAVLLKYGDLDSCLSMVFVPIRPQAQALYKSSGRQTWTSAVSREEIRAEYGKVRAIHSERYTDVAMPMFDLPIWQTEDQHGDEVLLDYFGTILERNETGQIKSTGKRWSRGQSEGALPSGFELGQNYPNPFNPTTTITFSMPKPGRCTIDITNVLGQRVKTLLNSEFPAGNHSVTWDGTDATGSKVASGIYFYRLHAGDFSATKKMLLMK